MFPAGVTQPSLKLRRCLHDYNAEYYSKNKAKILASRSTSQSKERARAAAQKYKAKNKLKLAEYNKEYRARNVEKLKDYASKYREDHRDQEARRFCRRAPLGVQRTKAELLLERKLYREINKDKLAIQRRDQTVRKKQKFLDLLKEDSSKVKVKSNNYLLISLGRIRVCSWY